jgi:hypothetical protein
MEKVSASLKAPTRSFMEISTMGSSRGKDNYILPLETIILGNLDLIKNKVAEYIIGQEKRAMFMKDNSRLAKEMAKELFGGVMEAGMKDNLETESKADGEFYIARVGIDNMRETGTMVCLTGREFNFSRMGNVMREHSNKTNFMEKVFSIKMIL